MVDKWSIANNLRNKDPKTGASVSGRMAIFAFLHRRVCAIEKTGRSGNMRPAGRFSLSVSRFPLAVKACLSAAKTCLVVLLSAPLALHAQPPHIGAKLVPDSVAIGDRFELEVTVEKDVMQVVDFPVFDDGMLTELIEIVGESPIDTLEQDGRRQTLGKRYVLTTFEEGIHPLGRFPALYFDKNIVDTLRSADSLTLRVGTFEIDTMTMTIRDLKPVMGAPFKVGEVSGYVAAGWWIAGLTGIALWLLFRRRRKSEGLGKPDPDDPPHVAAIKALEALHSQKLWQNNRHKLYYTRLTDILRVYIEGRWGVAAMEMTSDEIMDSLSDCNIDVAPLADLRLILRDADMVKFAKLTPPHEDNEAAWTKSYYFIENTKSQQEAEL